MPATPAVPHAGSTAKKLEALLTYHLEAVKNLQGSIALLTETAVATKAVNGNSVMLKALELEAARRNPVRGDEGEETDDVPPPKKKRARYGTGTVKRQKAAAFLAQFHPTKPTPVDHQGRIVTYVRFGFLAKKGAGYVRTAKPYAVVLSKSRQTRDVVPERLGKSGPKIQPGGPTAKRYAIAKVLEQTSRAVPKPFPLGNVTATVLVKHGYLRKLGRGYVRTAKRYHVSSYLRTSAVAKRAASRPRRAPSTKGRGRRQKAARDYNYKAKKQARRQHTADLLAQFNTETPSQPTVKKTQNIIGTLAALKRRGYLAETPGGYLRTGKTFVVTERRDHESEPPAVDAL